MIAYVLVGSSNGAIAPKRNPIAQPVRPIDQHALVAQCGKATPIFAYGG